MTTVLVFGGIALLIGAYFALEWWSAGRKKGTLGRARDGAVGNPVVDHAIIERQTKGTQNQTWSGPS